MLWNWFTTNRELKREIDGLRSEWRTLQLEWDSTYEKFRRLLARLARRVERAANGAEPELSEESAAAAAAGPALVHERQLTEHQVKVQQAILARRGRNAV